MRRSVAPGGTERVAVRHGRRRLAGDRTVAARRVLPIEIPDEATRRPWPVRRSDLDTLGHVNNTNYLSVVEEFLPGAWADGPLRIVVDYGAGVAAGAALTVAVDERSDRLDLWWIVDDTVVAAARAVPAVPTGG